MLLEHLLRAISTESTDRKIAREMCQAQDGSPELELIKNTGKLASPTQLQTALVKLASALHLQSNQRWIPILLIRLLVVVRACKLGVTDV